MSDYISYGGSIARQDKTEMSNKYGYELGELPGRVWVDGDPAP